MIMARTPFIMLIISVSFNLRADVELFNDLDSKPSKKTMEIDLFSDEKPQKRQINSVKTDRKATKKVHKRAKKASFGNLPKHQIPKKKFKKSSFNYDGIRWDNWYRLITRQWCCNT